MNFALTGKSPLADTRRISASMGGHASRPSYRRGGPQAPFYVGYTTNIIIEGTHTVRAWRELNGAEVPGSSLNFRYVSAGAAPPPPATATATAR